MAINNLPAKLTIATIGMFGFGFALVPLYDVFCDITGINGKGFERAPGTSNQSGAIEASISETQRAINVQFIASPQSGFSGNFYPASTTLPASLNRSVSTAYFARNASDKMIHLQAIPSISPSEASSYVTKMECFCFNQQSLSPGQTREMGLTFKISEDLPEHISTITFSYSLYPIESMSNEETHVRIDSTDQTGGLSNEPST